jgi:opacity protein-like surface antigen
MKKSSQPIMLVLGVATTLLSVTSAAAQIPERHLVRVGFGGGMSVPTSNAGDALDNGINGQAYLLVDPGLGFPLRFNLGYQKFDFKDALVGGPEGDSTILSGIGGLTFDLVSLGPVRPYVTAGIGAFNVRQEIEGLAGGSTSSTRFGIDGGGGLALTIGRLEAFVEGRVQNVYTDEGVIDSSSIRSVPVTFGILF